MKTPVRSLRMIAACSLLATLAACGSSTNNTSVNLSGTVNGLTEAGLLLSNGLSLAAVAQGSTNFVFPSRVLIGSAYSVQISVLPPNLSCTVAKGAGVARDNSDITNVAVTCVPRRNLGGTITGLTVGGLILANGTDTVQPAANARTFTFPGKVGQGSSYGVTVLQQPAPLTCNVAFASGVMGTDDISNVQVGCQ